MIARGMYHFTQSAAGEHLNGEYHLQAGIKPFAIAQRKTTLPQTGGQILSLYDHLLEFDHSPIVALNRTVALAEVRGPQAGIEAVQAIKDLRSLESYYLLHAVLGEFELRLNRPKNAATHFEKSLALAEIKSEQAFLFKRLQACR